MMNITKKKIFCDVGSFVFLILFGFCNKSNGNYRNPNKKQAEICFPIDF